MQIERESQLTLITSNYYHIRNDEESMREDLSELIHEFIKVARHKANRRFNYVSLYQKTKRRK